MKKKIFLLLLIIVIISIIIFGIFKIIDYNKQIITEKNKVQSQLVLCKKKQIKNKNQITQKDNEINELKGQIDNQNNEITELKKQIQQKDAEINRLKN